MYKYETTLTAKFTLPPPLSKVFWVEELDLQRVCNYLNRTTALPDGFYHIIFKVNPRLSLRQYTPLISHGISS